MVTLTLDSACSSYPEGSLSDAVCGGEAEVLMSFIAFYVYFIVCLLLHFYTERLEFVCIFICVDSLVFYITCT